MGNTQTPAKPPTRRNAVRDLFQVPNVVAGISVGAYIIPQAMAYGSLAGVTPSASLTISVVPLVVYMILGRNTSMSLGPESTVALMTAAAVGPVAASQGIPWATALAVTTTLVGVILGIGWLIKASFLADLLSNPILTGYMTGVAILMIVSQLPKILGFDLNTDTIGELISSEWQTPNAHTILIATIVVVLSLISRRISNRIPGPLLGLAVATLVGLFFTDIERVGEVSLELPAVGFQGFDVEVVVALMLPALSIAVVSFTDVMVTSRAFAGKERPNASMEMRALAGTQFASGMAGGYPMSASSSRTALAFAAGSTTRFYSVFVIVFIIAGPLLLPGVIAQVPISALAGVIVFAAITLVSLPDWTALARFRFGEVAVAATCTLAVVFVGILPGVLIAIVLSIVELLMRLARPHDGVLGFVPNMPGMHDIDDHDGTETLPGLLVFRYDAPLFFMNAYDFFYKVTGALEPDTQVVLLNMEANVELDTTALDVMDELHDTLDADGIDLWLARVKNDVLIPLRDHGTADIVGEENMYPTLPVAVDAYRERYLSD
ncbi:MAG: SulP family inorganic anion transporter [Actinobacteria bacterium]|nr:SulP family inorganic anion transporter [Actinomycetota bacterium]MCO5300438.1 SulP family inorganic anion transporter [Candidatus Nanopelagicales bacterium]MCB9430094.1 SulP family inorganic anion transporter [Actinomycetota bacterium]HPE13360.1 SulP family inorganic anion transporter [Actinomycetota bacterium]HPJ17816.1 SulP family inorganic anion transporter [Actinomycetota bacterium]